MKYIFILSSILSAVVSSGTKFDAVRYSNMVNKAELAITDTAYEKSIAYYDSAFLLKEKPFAVDIYNASVCAVKMSDKPKALYYCSVLSEVGVGDSFLSVSPVYEELKKMPQWQSILINAKAIKDSIISVNWILYKTLDEISAALVINNENLEKKNIELKTFHRIKDSLIGDYYKICQKTSIPAKDILQLEYTKEKGCRTRSLYQNLTFACLRSEKYGSLFIGLLEAKMSKGQISSFHFANLLDNGGNRKRPYYGAKVFNVLDCTILTHTSKENLSKIDNARRLIGIGSLDDDVKKIAFNQANFSSYMFIIYPIYYVYYEVDENAKSYIFQSSTVVVQNIAGCKK